MSATAGALGSLGNDLAFSVSYNIASELLDAASEAHLSEEELIGIVLGLAVVLSSVPSAVRAVWAELKRWRVRVSPDTAGKDPPAEGRSGITEFAGLLVDIAQRISVSICVQLLASNVRSRQPLRAVRVVSLLAVAIFFLFLESSSSIGSAARR
jgi:hypothetical protein